MAGLEGRGIVRPYTHQAEAIDAVHAGEDVVVVTPTASGKSLCYAMPILQAIAEDPAARALLLFPTKALGQDQVAEFGELAKASNLHVSASTYDGDTPAPIRSTVRAAGQVVVTNPDMLHSAILPHHTKWFQLFEQLRFIVIDELHTYRGVFGSHVANVLRRLLRICAHYGSHPVIVCCSATIGNPAELAIDADRPPGAPHRPQRRAGRRTPRRARRSADPAPGERGARLRGDARPALGAAVPARRAADDRLRAVAGRGRDPADRVCASPCARATARDRVSAATAAVTCRPSGGPSSTGCATARSSGVVATNALELGVDIGRLDVSILAGYPGSVAATWQQFGRAGRRQGTSVAVLVASGAAVDQYVIHHPEFLLEGTPEEARLDPDNLHVLLAHLRAATFELPFEPGERFGPAPADDLLAFLAEEGHVRQASDGRWYWSSENFPASEISLRTAAPENVVIIDTTPDRPRVLGEVDLFSAQVLVHERAIYIHESIQYYVDRLEWHERKAYVHRVDVDHYTYANRAVTLKPLDVFADAPAIGGRRIHGEVMVASLVTLFKKLKFVTDENVGWGPIDLPELELQTTAYWLTADASRGAMAAGRTRRGAARGRPGDPDRRGDRVDGRPARPRPRHPGPLAPLGAADHLPVRGGPRWDRPVRTAVGPPRRSFSRAQPTSSRRVDATPAARPAPARGSSPTWMRARSRCACWPSSGRRSRRPPDEAAMIDSAATLARRLERYRAALPAVLPPAAIDAREGRRRRRPRDAARGGRGRRSRDQPRGPDRPLRDPRSGRSPSTGIGWRHCPASRRPTSRSSASTPRRPVSRRRPGPPRSSSVSAGGRTPTATGRCSCSFPTTGRNALS